MADTPVTKPKRGAATPKGAADEPKPALRRLRHQAFLLLAGLLASLVAGVAAVVVLVNAPSTSDLQKLGLIAAVAGLAGGSARGVVEVASLVREGFRADGELEIYNGWLRKLHENEARRYEHDLERFEAAATAPAETQPFGPPQPPMPPPDPRVFSPELIAEFMILPITGAAFGVVVFAGVVGGFLVASTAAASYSPPALAFLAFLGGMFADQLLGKLASTADVLFGDGSRGSQPRPDR
jgi:hypothetical protein